MPYLYEIASKKFYPKIKTFENIQNKKILAFSPHSDDLSIGAGGFLAQLAKGNDIKPVLAYSGFRGVGGKVPEAQATKIRQEEMQKEAKILGLNNPIFLNLETYEKDSAKFRSQDKEKIKKTIEAEAPAIIFMPNKVDLHPRHKLLTFLVLQAIKELKWRGEIFFYEIPWSVFSSSEFNFIVPLSKVFAGKKMKAISAHKSQLKRTNFVRLSKALLSLRAGLVPEQKIGGYGSEKIFIGNWVEVFQYKKIQF